MEILWKINKTSGSNVGISIEVWIRYIPMFLTVDWWIIFYIELLVICLPSIWVTNIAYLASYSLCNHNFNLLCRVSTGRDTLAWGKYSWVRPMWTKRRGNSYDVTGKREGSRFILNLFVFQSWVCLYHAYTTHDWWVHACKFTKASTKA
jgi:hypothetical protein